MYNPIHIWPRLSQLRISHILKRVCEREGEFYFLAYELGQGACRQEPGNKEPVNSKRPDKILSPSPFPPPHTPRGTQQG